MRNTILSIIALTLLVGCSQKTDPAYVAEVVGAVSQHLDVEATDLARATTENACRFYGVG